MLKTFYADRWLRLHTFSNSKRYPENAKEWALLHDMQNIILNEVFNTNDELVIFTGQYSNKNMKDDTKIVEDNIALKRFPFKALNSIDIFAKTKQFIDEDSFFTPYYTRTLYAPNCYNAIQFNIAMDYIRAFFLNPQTNTIVAPYDGGIDIIYADTSNRDFYKNKYNKFTQQENFK